MVPSRTGLATAACIVVESFVAGDTPSTKAALAALRGISDAREGAGRALRRRTSSTGLSLRNVPTVHLLEAGQLNTYDVLVADEVVFTTEALEEFLGVPVTTGEPTRPVTAMRQTPMRRTRSEHDRRPA